MKRTVIIVIMFSAGFLTHAILDDEKDPFKGLGLDYGCKCDPMRWLVVEGWSLPLFNADGDTIGLDLKREETHDVLSMKIIGVRKEE